MKAPNKKKEVIVPHKNKEIAIRATSHLFVERAYKVTITLETGKATTKLIQYFEARRG